MADTWASIRADGDAARRDVEAARIRAALAAHGWSMSEAAIALGVNVETLSRYLGRRHPEVCAERRLRVSQKR